MPKPKTPPEPKWGERCTLHAAIRNLIERGWLADSGKGCENYQPVWLPDLPIGPPKMLVQHDCRKVPKEVRGSLVDSVFSMGFMNVNGHYYVMSYKPQAGERVYTAVCHNCHSVFFSSAWDSEDTLENYVKHLKAGKR